MLVHAVRALAASRAVDIVVVAAPEDTAESVASMLADQSFPAEVVVVTGGDTRQDSVARALITLPDDVDVVLVHDAARPLVPEELVTAVVASVRAGHPAVVPGDEEAFKVTRPLDLVLAEAVLARRRAAGVVG
jgi:2-C-methyl-D-erythritol 4-phosphate cytidylyltransferase